MLAFKDTVFFILPQRLLFCDWISSRSISNIIPLIRYANPLFQVCASVLVYQAYEKCWFIYVLRKPFRRCSEAQLDGIPAPSTPSHLIKTWCEEGRVFVSPKRAALHV